MKKYVGDFETATWIKDETWVWAWACCEIGNESNVIINNSIDSFIEFCEKEHNPTIYFHNLKFDGEFIIHYLLSNGFKHIEDKKYREDKTFTTLISDLGQFYSIEIYFKVGNKKVSKVTIYDSLKIIPFKVEKVSKAFNLKESKLKIDYNLPREKGHKLTLLEVQYIKNDVVIVAKALNELFKEKLTKMTQASNALADYKSIINKSKFLHFFPTLTNEVDKDLRPAYKGGFVFLNPIYKGKGLKVPIIVLDVNSLYPYVMYSKFLPVGDPIYFEGKYKDDKVYNLYVQRLTCSFKLKPGKIPTIQMKNSRYRSIFASNEYLESSKGEIVPLTLTNIDLQLFFENYEVSDLEYHSGYKFKSVKGLFTEYIDKWIQRKIEAGKVGNKGQRTIAKLMLNSLYGKFAKSPKVVSKLPFLGDDGIVHYSLSEETEGKTIYLPVGIFITSYARELTIRTSQAIKDYSINKYGIDKYIYSDTDSIHTTLTAEELKQFCNIDDFELGAWKIEENAKFGGKFIRQKCYLELLPKERNYKFNRVIRRTLNFRYKSIKGIDYYFMKITCAGMPESCYSEVTFNNFENGLCIKGKKLAFKHVKGGVILVPTDFTIKDL